MPHRRSVVSRLRRLSRKLILNNAFQCPIWAETICRVGQTEVNHEIIATLTVEDDLKIRRILNLEDNETIRDSHINRFVDCTAEHGLVLTDSRGRGAFQK